MWPVLLMVPVNSVVIVEEMEAKFVGLLNEAGVKRVGITADPDLIRETLAARGL